MPQKREDNDKGDEKDKGHDQKSNGGHDHQSHHAHMMADFRRRFWVSLIITIPILVLSPLIQEFFGFEGAISFSGDEYVLWGLSSLVYIYGGYPFLKGLYSELTSKSPGMMTLIGLAISVAYIYSTAVVFGLTGKVFFWELATLVDVMLLGHWIEMKSIMGASGALEELAKLMPAEAHRVSQDGTVEDIAIEQLKHGDHVLIKPGEKVPVDGIIVDGETSIDQSLITGESTPVPKAKDEEVIGGSINGDGSITVEIRKAGEDSYLSEMMRLVSEAQESKSRTQDLADRAALVLTIIAITAGAITISIWLTLMNEDFAFSLERSVTVMVITCPHALGLAIPLVVAVSTALSAKNGLLIRERNAFERARNIQAILFDKTGTLTKGEFGVTDTIVFSDEMTEQELLKYAASVESNSEHPIARGIASSSEETYSIDDFKSIPGKGAQARVEGKVVKVVSPGYVKENNMSVNGERMNEITRKGNTAVYVVIDDEVKGAIALADIIRDESKEAIKLLKENGIRCMMVTGDNEQVAKWVAEEIGLDEYFAGVLPDKKVEKIKEVQSRGLVVAMTGDGINDAPALAQADVGIAIGAGTDVAAASADIILVRSNPLDVVSVIQLSNATNRKMWQNLGWATGYNAFAIPIAAGALYTFGIILSPAVGAILMSVSTVIVAINARLLRFKGPQEINE